MKNIVLFIVIVAAISSCSETSESEKKLPEQKAIPNDSKQIAQGTYTCWQYNQTSPGDMQVLGDIVVEGNTYGGELHGKGSYTYDPSTKIVVFEGGGFDQRKHGKEWIGIYYQKGEQFIDGSGGKAANTMLVITARSDWEGGYKKAWIQQCDLK